LRQRLPSSARRALGTLDGSPHPSKENLKALVEELNTLIRGESLYDQQRFDSINLRDETRRLIELNSRSKNFTDLNRKLLEDTYPGEIYRRVRGDRALRIVFSMREDYIAELDPFAHLLPDRLTTRYRLERLRSRAALAAVTSPMRFTHLRFAEGVAEQLVENLLKTPVRTAGGENQEDAREFVETVQLRPNERSDHE
jgi:hypothetical protein